METSAASHALSVGCVVLAAGNARRFGQNKLAATLQGRSLIRRALDAVPARQLDSVIVVTQYAEIAAIAREYHFTAIRNAHPDWGISHSISLGLSALHACSGALFMVADQPLLNRESVSDLVSFWRAHPDCIAALGHNGVRGNPCLFPARFYPELLALREDHGGNTVIRAHEQDLLLLEVPARQLSDADTPHALERLRRETEP